MPMQATPETCEGLNAIEPQAVEWDDRADGVIRTNVVQDDQMNVAGSGVIGNMQAFGGLRLLRSKDISKVARIFKR